MPSHDPEAKRVPSGENDTALPAAPWPRVAIRSRVAMSHSLTVPSHNPEAKRVPSGENDTALTAAPWPRVAIRSRVATSHSLTVLSHDPEAKRVPSGEKDTDVTSDLDALGGWRPRFCGHVPQLDRAIHRPRSQCSAVGGKRHRSNRREKRVGSPHNRMPFEGSDPLSGPHIP